MAKKAKKAKLSTAKSRRTSGPKVKRDPLKKAGRKTGYSDACARKALAFMAKEPDLGSLAKELKIRLSTVYKWMEDHGSFKKAVEDGRGRFADKVETSFLQLAIPHDEVVEIEGDEKDETRTKKDVVSVRAAERVLKAYKRDTYGDKLDVQGNVNVTVVDFASVK